MSRTIAALIGGVLLGILAMLAVARFGPSSSQSPDAIVRDIVDVPKMTQAVAEKHRDEQYAQLTSIEEVMALPTEFARSEALYVLAGRSGSADIQRLIFEANRIADDEERISLLNILFFRLADTDPRSALAHARTDSFKSVRSIERTVWRTWARKDLDDALYAARTQTSTAHQNEAAQSLYAAYGYMGNATTKRIEAELSIGPDRSSRARYLYRLADKSPADAIAYINGLERGTEQQQYVSWLAYYVSAKDPDAALRYASLFRVASDGEGYERIIKGNIARENPQETIERLLASGRTAQSSSEYRYAIGALVSTDLDAAKRYFEQARSSDDRRMFGRVIAMEMAKNDPAEAMAWARENEDEEYPLLQMSVLGQIAEIDPQLAMAEALNAPNAETRSRMVSNVVQYIARNNPADAVNYLDQIPNGQQKLEASQHLASAWIEQDPEAAVAWILGQDKETAGQMIQMVAHRLVGSDIDMAIQLLPKMDERNQANMRQQIAQRLATIRSPGEAQSFIRQFEGQPGYDQLQASVVAGVAQTDVLMAKQLADQLVDSTARDSAYTQLIAQHAQTNPAEAARWLYSMSDESARGAAAGQLASQWYAYDPAAAARWVNNLPAGSLRDDSIVHMSSRWRNPTADQEDLIASIDDRDKRGQAKIRYIYNVMRTDPVKARKLLEDEDISSQQRQQIETMISQGGLRY